MGVLDLLRPRITDGLSVQYLDILAESAGHILTLARALLFASGQCSLCRPRLPCRAPLRPPKVLLLSPVGPAPPLILLTPLLPIRSALIFAPQIEDALEEDVKGAAGGRFRLSPRRVNLRRVIEKSHSSCLVQKRFKEHVAGLRVTLEVSADLQRTAYLDPGRTFQLLSNVRMAGSSCLVFAAAVLVFHLLRRACLTPEARLPPSAGDRQQYQVHSKGGLGAFTRKPLVVRRSSRQQPAEQNSFLPPPRSCRLAARLGSLRSDCTAGVLLLS